MAIVFGLTDLASAIDVSKTTPAEISRRALDGRESGLEEVMADELTKLAKQGRTALRPSYLPQVT